MLPREGFFGLNPLPIPLKFQFWFMVKSAYEPSGQSGWHCISPLRWNASASQGFFQHYIPLYSFIHLGGERYYEGKVSCPRTQHNVPSQGSSSDCSIRR